MKRRNFRSILALAMALCMVFQCLPVALGEELAVASVVSDKSSVMSGGSVTWTAQAVGGDGEYRYCFYLYNPDGTVTKNAYSTSNTYNASLSDEGSYRVKAYARDGSNTLVSNWSSYVTVTAPDPLSVKSVTANKSSVKAGESVTWTAQAAGGDGEYRYCFYLYNPDGTVTKNPYSTSNTYTASLSDEGSYRVKAYAKDGTNTLVSNWSSYVTVTAPDPLSVTSVTMDKTAVKSGESVTWTAQAAGGDGDYQYCFYLYNPDGTITKNPYSALNTYTATLEDEGDYRVRAYVRDGAKAPVSKYSSYVTVTAPDPLKVTGLTVSSAAVTVGDSVTWTEQASGGKGEKLYNFYLYKPDGTIDKSGYITENTLTLTLDEPGDYYVRAYAKDEAGMVRSKTGGNVSVAPELAITAVVADKTALTQGDTVTWTATAEGGRGDKTYFFYVYKPDGTRESSGKFIADNTFSYTCEDVGEYYARAYVNDETGRKYKNGGNVTVTAPEPLIIDSLVSDVTSAPEGASVTWTVTATGGVGDKTYNFFIFRPDGTIYKTGYQAENSVTFDCEEAGEYTARAYAKDIKGSVKSRSGAAVTVYEPLKVLSVVGDKTSAETGESVTWTVTASGGQGDKTYCFYVYLDGVMIDKVPYSADNTYTHLCDTAGSYHVKGYVKDITSVRGRLSATVAVNDPIVISSVEVDKPSVMTGESVTWTMTATGGVGELVYNFTVYKPDGTVQKSGYTDKASYAYTIEAAGEYYVRAFAKDTEGTFIAKNGGYVTAIDKLVVTAVTPDKTEADVGADVTWTIETEGGAGDKSYCFVVRLDGTKIEQTPYTDALTYTRTLDLPGEYVVTGYAMDDTGKVSLRSAPVTAKVPLSIKSITSDQDLIFTGESVTWTIAAEGGEGDKTYRFLIYCDGVRVYTGDFGADNSYTYACEAPGRYSVRGYVKDDTGTATLAGGKMNVMDPIPVSVESMTADRTAATEGDTVTWTAVAQDGKGEKSYRYYLYKDGVLTYLSPYVSDTTFSYTCETEGVYRARAYVRDETGAASGYSAYLTVTPAFSVSSVTADQPYAGEGGSLVFTAEVSGGIAPFTYAFKAYKDGVAISDGTANEKTFTLNDLAAGDYAVECTATDARGTKATLRSTAVPVYGIAISLSDSFTTVYAGGEAGGKYGSFEAVPSEELPAALHIIADIAVKSGNNVGALSLDDNNINFSGVASISGERVYTLTASIARGSDVIVSAQTDVTLKVLPWDSAKLPSEVSFTAIEDAFAGEEHALDLPAGVILTGGTLTAADLAFSIVSVPESFTMGAGNASFTPSDAGDFVIAVSVSGIGTNLTWQSNLAVKVSPALAIDAIASAVSTDGQTSLVNVTTIAYAGESDITFTPDVMGGEEPYAYAWEVYKDGVKVESLSGADETFTLSKPAQVGVYKAKLTVTDDAGRIVTGESAEVTVIEPLRVNITWGSVHPVPIIGEQINFSFSADGGSEGALAFAFRLRNTTASEQWGEFENVQNPHPFTPSAAGVYEVQFKTTDGNGYVYPTDVTQTQFSFTVEAARVIPNQNSCDFILAGDAATALITFSTEGGIDPSQPITWSASVKTASAPITVSMDSGALNVASTDSTYTGDIDAICTVTAEQGGITASNTVTVKCFGANHYPGGLFAGLAYTKTELAATVRNPMDKVLYSGITAVGGAFPDGTKKSILCSAASSKVESAEGWEFTFSETGTFSVTLRAEILNYVKTLDIPVVVSDSLAFNDSAVFFVIRTDSDACGGTQTDSADEPYYVYKGASRVEFTPVVEGGREPYAYKWEIGGATVGTEANYILTPAADTNDFSVTLTVTDADGREINRTSDFTAVEPLELSITYPASRAPGESLTITGSAAGGAGGYEYKFRIKNLSETSDWGSFGEWQESGDFIYTLMVSGLYEFQLVAKDRNGCETKEVYGQRQLCVSKLNPSAEVGEFILAGDENASLLTFTVEAPFSSNGIVWSVEQKDGGEIASVTIENGKLIVSSLNPAYSADIDIPCTVTAVQESDIEYRASCEVTVRCYGADHFDGGLFTSVSYSKEFLATTLGTPAEVLFADITPVGGAFPSGTVFDAQCGAASSGQPIQGGYEFNFTVTGEYTAKVKASILNYTREGSLPIYVYEPMIADPDNPVALDITVHEFDSYLEPAPDPLPVYANDLVKWTPNFTGGSGEYEYHYIITFNGNTCIDEKHGEPKFYEPEEPGLYAGTIIVTDLQTGQEVSFTIPDLTALPIFTLGELTVNHDPVIVGSPLTLSTVITGGEGTVTVNFSIIDELGAPVTEMTVVSGDCTFTPAAPGVYFVETSATDGNNRVTRAEVFVLNVNPAEFFVDSWLDRTEFYNDRGEEFHVGGIYAINLPEDTDDFSGWTLTHVSGDACELYVSNEWDDGFGMDISARNITSEASGEVKYTLSYTACEGYYNITIPLTVTILGAAPDNLPTHLTVGDEAKSVNAGDSLTFLYNDIQPADGVLPDDIRVSREVWTNDEINRDCVIEDVEGGLQITFPVEGRYIITRALRIGGNYEVIAQTAVTVGSGNPETFSLVPDQRFRTLFKTDDPDANFYVGTVYIEGASLTDAERRDAEWSIESGDSPCELYIDNAWEDNSGVNIHARNFDNTTGTVTATISYSAGIYSGAVTFTLNVADEAEKSLPDTLVYAGAKYQYEDLPLEMVIPFSDFSFAKDGEVWTNPDDLDIGFEWDNHGSSMDVEQTEDAFILHASLSARYILTVHALVGNIRYTTDIVIMAGDSPLVYWRSNIPGNYIVYLSDLGEDLFLGEAHLLALDIYTDEGESVVWHLNKVSGDDMNLTVTDQTNSHGQDGLWALMNFDQTPAAGTAYYRLSLTFTDHDGHTYDWEGKTFGVIVKDAPAENEPTGITVPQTLIHADAGETFVFDVSDIDFTGPDGWELPDNAEPWYDYWLPDGPDWDWVENGQYQFTYDGVSRVTIEAAAGYGNRTFIKRISVIPYDLGAIYSISFRQQTSEIIQSALNMNPFIGQAFLSGSDTLREGDTVLWDISYDGAGDDPLGMEILTYEDSRNPAPDVRAIEDAVKTAAPGTYHYTILAAVQDENGNTLAGGMNASFSVTVSADWPQGYEKPTAITFANPVIETNPDDTFRLNFSDISFDQALPPELEVAYCFYLNELWDENNAHFTEDENGMDVTAYNPGAYSLTAVARVGGLELTCDFIVLVSGMQLGVDMKGGFTLYNDTGANTLMAHLFVPGFDEKGGDEGIYTITPPEGCPFTVEAERWGEQSKCNLVAKDFYGAEEGDYDFTATLEYKRDGQTILNFAYPFTVTLRPYGDNKPTDIVYSGLTKIEVAKDESFMLYYDDINFDVPVSGTPNKEFDLGEMWGCSDVEDTEGGIVVKPRDAGYYRIWAVIRMGSFQFTQEITVVVGDVRIDAEIYTQTLYNNAQSDDTYLFNAWLCNVNMDDNDTCSWSVSYDGGEAPFEVYVNGDGQHGYVNARSASGVPAGEYPFTLSASFSRRGEPLFTAQYPFTLTVKEYSGDVPTELVYSGETPLYVPLNEDFMLSYDDIALDIEIPQGETLTRDFFINDLYDQEIAEVVGRDETGYTIRVHRPGIYEVTVVAILGSYSFYVPLYVVAEPTINTDVKGGFTLYNDIDSDAYMAHFYLGGFNEMEGDEGTYTLTPPDNCPISLHLDTWGEQSKCNLFADSAYGADAGEYPYTLTLDYARDGVPLLHLTKEFTVTVTSFGENPPTGIAYAGETLIQLNPGDTFALRYDDIDFDQPVSGDPQKEFDIGDLWDHADIIDRDEGFTITPRDTGTYRIIIYLRLGSFNFELPILLIVGVGADIGANVRTFTLYNNVQSEDTALFDAWLENIELREGESCDWRIDYAGVGEEWPFDVHANSRDLNTDVHAGSVYGMPAGDYLYHLKASFKQDGNEIFQSCYEFTVTVKDYQGPVPTELCYAGDNPLYVSLGEEFSLNRADIALDIEVPQGEELKVDFYMNDLWNNDYASVDDDGESYTACIKCAGVYEVTLAACMGSYSFYVPLLIVAGDPVRLSTVTYASAVFNNVRADESLLYTFDLLDDSPFEGIRGEWGMRYDGEGNDPLDLYYTNGERWMDVKGSGSYIDAPEGVYSYTAVCDVFMGGTFLQSLEAPFTVTVESFTGNPPTDMYYRGAARFDIEPGDTITLRESDIGFDAQIPEDAQPVRRFFLHDWQFGEFDRIDVSEGAEGKVYELTLQTPGVYTVTAAIYWNNFQFTKDILIVVGDAGALNSYLFTDTVYNNVESGELVISQASTIFEPRDGDRAEWTLTHDEGIDLFIVPWGNPSGADARLNNAYGLAAGEYHYNFHVDYYHGEEKIFSADHGMTLTVAAYTGENAPTGIEADPEAWYINPGDEIVISTDQFWLNGDIPEGALVRKWIYTGNLHEMAELDNRDDGLHATFNYSGRAVYEVHAVCGSFQYSRQIAVNVGDINENAGFTHGLWTNQLYGSDLPGLVIGGAQVNPDTLYRKDDETIWFGVDPVSTTGDLDITLEFIQNDDCTGDIKVTGYTAGTSGTATYKLVWGAGDYGGEWEFTITVSLAAAPDHMSYAGETHVVNPDGNQADILFSDFSLLDANGDPWVNQADYDIGFYCNAPDGVEVTESETGYTLAFGDLTGRYQASVEAYVGSTVFTQTIAYDIGDPFAGKAIIANYETPVYLNLLENGDEFFYGSAFVPDFAIIEGEDYEWTLTEKSRSAGCDLALSVTDDTTDWYACKFYLTPGTVAGDAVYTLTLTVGAASISKDIPLSTSDRALDTFPTALDSGLPVLRMVGRGEPIEFDLNDIIFANGDVPQTGVWRNYWLAEGFEWESYDADGICTLIAPDENTSFTVTAASGFGNFTLTKNITVIVGDMPASGCNQTAFTLYRDHAGDAEFYSAWINNFPDRDGNYIDWYLEDADGLPFELTLTGEGTGRQIHANGYAEAEVGDYSFRLCADVKNAQNVTFFFSRFDITITIADFGGAFPTELVYAGDAFVQVNPGETVRLDKADIDFDIPFTGDGNVYRDFYLNALWDGNNASVESDDEGYSITLLNGGYYNVTCAIIAGSVQYYKDIQIVCNGFALAEKGRFVAFNDVDKEGNEGYFILNGIDQREGDTYDWSVAYAGAGDAPENLNVRADKLNEVDCDILVNAFGALEGEYPYRLTLNYYRGGALLFTISSDFTITVRAFGGIAPEGITYTPSEYSFNVGDDYFFPFTSIQPTSPLPEGVEAYYEFYVNSLWDIADPDGREDGLYAYFHTEGRAIITACMFVGNLTYYTSVIINVGDVNNAASIDGELNAEVLFASETTLAGKDLGAFTLSGVRLLTSEVPENPWTITRTDSSPLDIQVSMTGNGIISRNFHVDSYGEGTEGTADFTITFAAGPYRLTRDVTLDVRASVPENMPTRVVYAYDKNINIDANEPFFIPYADFDFDFEGGTKVIPEGMTIVKSIEDASPIADFPHEWSEDGLTITFLETGLYYMNLVCSVGNYRRSFELRFIVGGDYEFGYETYVTTLYRYADERVNGLDGSMAQYGWIACGWYDNYAPREGDVLDWSLTPIGHNLALPIVKEDNETNCNFDYDFGLGGSINDLPVGVYPYRLTFTLNGVVKGEATINITVTDALPPAVPCAIYYDLGDNARVELNVGDTLNLTTANIRAIYDSDNDLGEDFPEGTQLELHLWNGDWDDGNTVYWNETGYDVTFRRAGVYQFNAYAFIGSLDWCETVEVIVTPAATGTITAENLIDTLYIYDGMDSEGDLASLTFEGQESAQDIAWTIMRTDGAAFEAWLEDTDAPSRKLLRYRNVEGPGECSFLISAISGDGTMAIFDCTVMADYIFNVPTELYIPVGNTRLDSTDDTLSFSLSGVAGADAPLPEGAGVEAYVRKLQPDGCCALAEAEDGMTLSFSEAGYCALVFRASLGSWRLEKSVTVACDPQNNPLVAMSYTPSVSTFYTGQGETAQEVTVAGKAMLSHYIPLKDGEFTVFSVEMVTEGASPAQVSIGSSNYYSAEVAVSNLTGVTGDFVYRVTCGVVNAQSDVVFMRTADFTLTFTDVLPDHLPASLAYNLNDEPVGGLVLSTGDELYLFDENGDARILLLDADGAVITDEPANTVKSYVVDEDALYAANWWKYAGHDDPWGVGDPGAYTFTLAVEIGNLRYESALTVTVPFSDPELSIAPVFSTLTRGSDLFIVVSEANDQPIQETLTLNLTVADQDLSVECAPEQLGQPLRVPLTNLWLDEYQLKSAQEAYVALREGDGYVAAGDPYIIPIVEATTPSFGLNAVDQTPMAGDALILSLVCHNPALLSEDAALTLTSRSGKLSWSGVFPAGAYSKQVTLTLPDTYGEREKDVLYLSYNGETITQAAFTTGSGILLLPAAYSHAAVGEEVFVSFQYSSGYSAADFTWGPDDKARVTPGVFPYITGLAVGETSLSILRNGEYVADIMVSVYKLDDDPEALITLSADREAAVYGKPLTVTASFTPERPFVSQSSLQYMIQTLDENQNPVGASGYRFVYTDEIGDFSSELSGYSLWRGCTSMPAYIRITCVSLNGKSLSHTVPTLTLPVVAPEGIACSVQKSITGPYPSNERNVFNVWVQLFDPAWADEIVTLRVGEDTLLSGGFAYVYGFYSYSAVCPWPEEYIGDNYDVKVYIGDILLETIPVDGRGQQPELYLSSVAMQPEESCWISVSAGGLEITAVSADTDIATVEKESDEQFIVRAVAPGETTVAFTTPYGKTTVLPVLVIAPEENIPARISLSAGGAVAIGDVIPFALVCENDYRYALNYYQVSVRFAAYDADGNQLGDSYTSIVSKWRFDDNAGRANMSVDASFWASVARDGAPATVRAECVYKNNCEAGSVSSLTWTVSGQDEVWYSAEIENNQDMRPGDEATLTVVCHNADLLAAPVDVSFYFFNWIGDAASVSPASANLSADNPQAVFTLSPSDSAVPGENYNGNLYIDDNEYPDSFSVSISSGGQWNNSVTRYPYVGERFLAYVVEDWAKPYYTFRSDNESVLTIDGDGYATALTAGGATLYAVYNEYNEDNEDFTVINQPDESLPVVNLTADDSLTFGDDIYARLVPEEAVPMDYTATDTYATAAFLDAQGNTLDSISVNNAYSLYDIGHSERMVFFAGANMYAEASQKGVVASVRLTLWITDPNPTYRLGVSSLTLPVRTYDRERWYDFDCGTMFDDGVENLYLWAFAYNEGADADFEIKLGDDVLFSGRFTQEQPAQYARVPLTDKFYGENTYSMYVDGELKTSHDLEIERPTISIYPARLMLTLGEGEKIVSISGMYSSLSVTAQPDERVATAIVSGKTLTVTPVGAGETTLTLTSNYGSAFTLTIIVYDPDNPDNIETPKVKITPETDSVALGDRAWFVVEIADPLYLVSGSFYANHQSYAVVDGEEVLLSDSGMSFNTSIGRVKTRWGVMLE